MINKEDMIIELNKKKIDIISIVVWLFSTIFTLILQHLIHGDLIITPNYIVPFMIFIPFILHEPLHFLGFILNGVSYKNLKFKTIKGLLPTINPVGFVDINTYIKAILFPNLIIPTISFIFILISDLYMFSIVFGFSMFLSVIDFYIIKELKSYSGKVICLKDKFGFLIN